MSLARGKFRVRGDIVEVLPAYKETAFRVEFSGDRVEKISEIHPVTGDVITDLKRLAVYPAKHFVTTDEKVKAAVKSIGEELEERLKELRREGKLLEAVIRSQAGQPCRLRYKDRICQAKLTPGESQAELKQGASHETHDDATT